MANVEIAKRSRDDFYYQDKIYPHGRYNQTPNRFEKHVMENPDQFASGQEGLYYISANGYWTKKIKDIHHPVLADYAYQNIMFFYDGVWEGGGDGFRHKEELISMFSEWVNKYPEHDKVPLVQKIIECMVDGRSYYIQEAVILYEQQKYFESINILESDTETDGYKWYLVLLNEEKIGGNASIGIMKRDDETYKKYIEYVKDHPDRSHIMNPVAVIF